VLREARQWFLLEFNPESFAELVKVMSGERNAAFPAEIRQRAGRMAYPKDRHISVTAAMREGLQPDRIGRWIVGKICMQAI